MATMRAWGAVATLVVIVGCGGSQKRADIDPGPMPDGGTFSGVWQSPQYGEMHMVQQGSNVVGEFEKDERSGRIQGTVQGNVLRFQWTETREMVRGNPTVTQGRGYFEYEVGEDGRHYAIGEWGLDDAETGGGPWRAYKLKGRRPEMSTSGGEQPQQAGGSDFGGSDFDGSQGGGAPPTAGPEPDDSIDPSPSDESRPEPVDDALEGLDEF